jgi:hypothetical protein
MDGADDKTPLLVSIAVCSIAVALAYYGLKGLVVLGLLAAVAGYATYQLDQHIIYMRKVNQL